MGEGARDTAAPPVDLRAQLASDHVVLARRGAVPDPRLAALRGGPFGAMLSFEPRELAFGALLGFPLLDREERPRSPERVAFTVEPCC
ncbi:MAG: hypothetical protein ACLQMH_13510 [Solirubrobacteraceae bacterium]